jgi:hypothetical protein
MAAVTIRTRALAIVALLVAAGQVDAGRPLVTDGAPGGAGACGGRIRSRVGDLDELL